MLEKQLTVRRCASWSQRHRLHVLFSLSVYLRPTLPLSQPYKQYWYSGTPAAAEAAVPALPTALCCCGGGTHLAQVLAGNVPLHT